MLKCLAIDDEPLALDLLENSIGKVPYLQLIAKCSDAFEAMEIMRHHDIDLVFVDVQMPGLTGLQFIESLVQKPMVILITAYQKFALHGYSLNVVDYLLKPVELSRFIAACNKAWELHQLKHSSRQQGGTPAQAYFFVPAEHSLIKIVFTDILWIEGWKDYLKIYVKGNPRPVISRMTLKDAEQELPTSQFLRIHKSYIVATEHISVIKKNSVFIGEKELPVGESYKEVLDRLTRKGNQI